MAIFPSGKGVGAPREVFQPTKETPIKPSLLLLTNAKDNEIHDLICDHASLIPCCFTHWQIYPLTKTWPVLVAVKISECNVQFYNYVKFVASFFLETFTVTKLS